MKRKYFFKVDIINHLVVSSIADCIISKIKIRSVGCAFVVSIVKSKSELPD